MTYLLLAYSNCIIYADFVSVVIKGWKKGVYISSRLISWGRIGDGVIVPKTAVIVQYTICCYMYILYESAFHQRKLLSSSEIHYCANSLNWSLSSSWQQQEEGRKREAKWAKASYSQVGRVKWIYELQLQWTRIALSRESLNFGKYDGRTDR